MADRSISISLEAKVQGFVSGIKTAQQATKDFGDRTAAFARENEQNLDRVGKASMVMGGALLAGVGFAVKSFMEFDSAMSEVQASTHETEANMDRLREAAVNAGADTAFSAKEAAQGIDELAKAGVSTQDILGGGLTGALSLAAAGSLDVGEAAEIAASALTQFKLSGDKVPHLADLLAAAAGKAQGSVQDMGAALNQTGLVAASTGLSIEETTAGLAAFASAGLTGSDAGTSFKSMLQRLTPQSAEAEAKMKELGISAYDAQGQFIGLAKFSENLKESMKKLDPEARNAAMGVIFGSDAVRAANVLYEQGAAGISSWTEKVNDAGYAAVTASIKQDNLAGDIEKLGGSMDSVFIKSGSGVAESLRGLVQGAEDMVDAFGKIPTPILNAGVGIAGIAGSALLLTGAVATGLPKYIEFRDSMSALADKSPRAATGIGKVAKAAGLAAAAMVALQVVSAVFTEKEITSAEEFGQALLKVNKAASVTDTSGLDSLFTTWDKFAGEGPDIRDLAGAVKEITNPHIPAGIQDTLDGMFAWTGSAKNDLGQVRDRFKGLGDEMGNLAKNGAADTAAKTFQALTKEFEANGKGAKEALEAVPGYKDALLGLAFQAGETLEGQDLLDFAMGKVPAFMEGAAAATQTYTDAAGQSAPVTEEMAEELEKLGVSAEGAVSVMNAFVEVMQRSGLLALSERETFRSYSDALAEVGLNADGTGAAVGEMGLAFDNSTEQGKKNQAMFDAVASAGMNTTQAMADATDAFGANVYSQEQLQANLGTTFNNLVTAAGQFGVTGGAADALARKVMGIPPGVKIESWMSDYALQLAQQTTGALDKLDGRKVTSTIELINRTINTSEYREDPSMAALNPATHANGGRVNYLAGGGRPRLYDMQPRGTDTVPAMLTPGEFVVNEDATSRNLGLLHAINSGYRYQPASAPARQAAPMGSGQAGGTVNANFTINQVDDPIGTSHSVARRMSALAV